MKCPKCGADISENSKFCFNCGKNIQEQSNESYSSEIFSYDNGADNNSVKPQIECTYCHALIPSDAKSCPYCAEPVHKRNLNPTVEEQTENYIWSKSVFDLTVAYPIITILFGLFGIFLYKLFNDYAPVPGKTKILIFIVSALLSALICTVSHFNIKNQLENERKTGKLAKKAQRYTDSTSICPKCGSHDIKIYPKGYDWGEAATGEVFGIDTWKYTAGAGSNDAMCYCRNCGKTWNSGKDIRKLDIK